MDPSTQSEALAPVQLPRITIRFCTQCKWMLRAAYFAQELLSTFSTSLGEVALIPSTGGVFTVDIAYAAQDEGEDRKRMKTQTARLWDRKSEGGFPETKILKKLVRDIIDPSRDLGHVDGKSKSILSAATAKPESDSKRMEDGEKEDDEVEGKGVGSVLFHDAEAGVMREVGAGERAGSG